MNFFDKLQGALGRLGAKVQQLMIGRYGTDQFTLCLLILSMIFTFLGNFRPIRFMYFIGLAFIFYALYRTMSKKYEARRKELNWYLRWSEKPRAELRLLSNKIRDRKTHKYFKCKECKTVMRVPTNRGKIEITCPRCRAKCIKKT